MKTEILYDCGIDVGSGVARCMGDADFYVKILTVFINDKTFSRAKAALEKEDSKTLYESIHELRGVCGNLEMNELYRLLTPLAELLKGEHPDMKSAARLMSEAEAGYNHVCKGIKAFLDS